MKLTHITNITDITGLSRNYTNPFESLNAIRKQLGFDIIDNMFNSQDTVLTDNRIIIGFVKRIGYNDFIMGTL